MCNTIRCMGSNYILKKDKVNIKNVKKLIGKNYSDEDILHKLKMRPDVLRRCKRSIRNKDKLVFENLEPSTVYSDYLLKSQNMVKSLHKMRKKFEYKSQWGALIASIKQEKEIYDACIKYGQEFGFISKKAAELEISGEFAFNHMSDAEVREEIKIEMDRLNALASGKVINLRPELAELVDAEVTRDLPSHIINVSRDLKKKIKIKVKTKVMLRK